MNSHGPGNLSRTWGRLGAGMQCPRSGQLKGILSQHLRLTVDCEPFPGVLGMTPHLCGLLFKGCGVSVWSDTDFLELDLSII